MTATSDDRVKFGIALTNQHPVGRDQREALAEQLRLLAAARDAGWDSVFAAHHYLSDPLTHIQPLPYLARLAAESGEMEVGIGILLLALHNPVDVAESYASLDVVCGGRLVFGVGLGYRQKEYDAFGIPVRQRVRRLESNLDLVRRLWAGESVDADLPWCRLRGARLTLRPVRESGPPVWMAANNDGAVERAGRLADTWMINPHATAATIERQIALFRQARRAAGRPEHVGLPLSREIFCAPTRAEAVELARPYLHRKYQTYSAWGQDQVMPANESFDGPFEQLENDRFVIGSPEDCVRLLLPWRRLGVDHFVLRTSWAGMPVEDSLRSIDLLSREVIPALRDA